VINVAIRDKNDVFDFSALIDGQCAEIETSLPFNPVEKACRENGELHVILQKFYGPNPTQEELFPQWQVIE